MDPLDLQARIEERIRSEYVGYGQVQFWPDQFVDARLGEHSAVLDALRALTVAGKLSAWVQVLSDSGHTCWAGSPEEFAEKGIVRCPDLECKAVLNDNAYAALYFRMSARWRNAIDEEKKRSGWALNCPA